jgi:hypothetical protein
VRYCAVVAAVAGSALAIGATAIAGNDPWQAKYNGGPDSGGVVKFGTETLNGHHVVFGLKLRRIPVACSGDGGPAKETSNGDVSTQIKLNGKEIHYRATASNPGLDSTLTFDGTLTHGRNKAKGTVRINGDLVPVNNSQTTARPCDSGVLSWTGKRK